MSHNPEPHPQWVPPQPQRDRPPLVRATAESVQMPTPWLAGVASGISIHLGVSVTTIRVIFALSAVTMLGAGLIAYLLLIALIPQDNGEYPTTTRGAQNLTAIGENRRQTIARNQSIMAGVALITTAGLLLLVLRTSELSIRTVFATLIVLTGLGMAWTQASNTTQWRSLKFWVFLGSGLILVVTGISLFLSGNGATGELIRGALFGGGMILILLITLAPLWVRMSKQLSRAQEKQVRETERADIAAHLHDSVLQTLTLIRSAAENPAKVRALALTQERELRAWLYTGQTQATHSAAEALREAATHIEATYGIPIDTVTVGDLTPGANELALIAAAAEAMTNAARHGQPPISAYMETTTNTTDIYIKDRGPGFDLATIPNDRHGVRGSIIGRVERVGGTATLRRLNPGIEIHLSVPRSDPNTTPTT